jgi:hypothetical protein
MKIYGDILLGTKSTEIEQGDIVAKVCRCFPTMLIPASFWGNAKLSNVGLVAQPRGAGPSLSEIASAWQKVVGANAAVELVTHVVLSYDDVRGVPQEVAFAIGKPGDDIEPPESLLRLKGHERLLPASVEPPSVAEQCGKPAPASLLFGPVGEQINKLSGGLAGRLRNVAEAILRGPDNATKLASCA